MILGLMGLAACDGVSSGSDSSSDSITLGEGVRAPEKPESYAVADSSTYEGTDPVEIINEHCAGCHEQVPNYLPDIILSYKATTPAEAKAVAEEMALVCNNISQEQIDALEAYYMPETD